MARGFNGSKHNEMRDGPLREKDGGQLRGEIAVKSPRNFSKGMLALIIAVAVLASTVTTLLAVMFTNRNTVPKGYVPEGYISIDDAQALIAAATLPAGAMNMEFQEISDAEADQIANGADEIRENFENNPMAGNVEVNPREWDTYASRIATEGMSNAEKTLYDRYDACCREYLEKAMDGYRGGQNGNYFYYGSAVRFGDLNLSKDQAQSLFYWFKFNNPQYYFLRNAAASSGTSMFPMMYERFADGNERARTTNELFDKLDGWIESISGGGATGWQMELAANDLLCRKLDYDEKEPFYQSMYSAVLLERTVCAGYSETFCAMMNAVGVDAMVALNDVHAWNVVRLDDGSYYVVDVLWNENKENNDDPKRAYLNVGETTAKARDSGKAEHTFGADLAAWAPALSQVDYVPTQYDTTGSGGGAVHLDPPRNLRATSDEDGVVGVEWDPVDGADQYTVELYTSDGKTLLKSKSFDKTDITVRFGSYTSLAVRVCAEAQEDGTVYPSGWSEFLTITTKTGSSASTPAPTPTPGVTLDAPKHITITKDKPEEILFSWDEVEGAEQYQIVVFKDKAYTETWVSSFSTGTSKGYKKLVPGRTYYYGVRAVKTVGGEEYYSDWTHFSHKTPEEAAPTPTPGVTLDAPKHITVTKDEPTASGFSWDEVKGADQYEFVLFKDAGHTETWVGGFREDTSGSFKKLTPNTTYYYGVRAVKTVDGKDYYSDWTYFSHKTPENTV